jgi:hypothetical protein
MDATLPLDQMTVDEKLRAMESLWADLRRNEKDIPIPDWHREALKETEQRVREGQEEPMDWDEAKKRLRQRFE